ncbi:MAG: microcystin degradation protein MlrC [Betaproteobacteria bacterium RIFCSPLOWO2_02_FULL_67_19]|nr:MAG: microcystin degradation protein MlrC [Betaproteobacteria bacterium RIFCSPLOWO2_02_FULL_67_19]
MARIAIGGMQHETNTFAPSRADYAAFEAGGGWPGVQYGEPLFAAVEGANIPAAGAIQALRSMNHTLLPAAWAAASPSAQVTTEAFERIVGELLAHLEAALPLDGVYLDLHGAMVTEAHDDGEGEILRRVRERVGARVPIAVSLDLHANVTRAMIERADAMVAYRTYPHVDMADTGARAARLLDRMLRSGARLASAWQGFEFLTGIPSQCSFIEPCRSIYRLLGELENRHDAVLSFTPGFPMADFDECGMAVLGYGGAQRDVASAVEALRACVADSERDFALELHAPDDAVARAKRRGEPGAPVVLADTQDNPGAGGNGDTTGLLAALVRHQARDATLGLLVDPAAAARAHAAGQGATLAFSLGGRSGIPGDAPFAGEFTVERLGDGRFTCTGPMFKGFRMTLGPMALLRSRAAPGVRVALATRKCQAADQEMFRHLGVEPRRERILALKSSVHFRADFEPIAREVLVVKAPGPALADPAEFRWTKLRKGVRLRPLGPAFGG